MPQVNMETLPHDVLWAIGKNANELRGVSSKLRDSFDVFCTTATWIQDDYGGGGEDVDVPTSFLLRCKHIRRVAFVGYDATSSEFAMSSVPHAVESIRVSGTTIQDFKHAASLRNIRELDVSYSIIHDGWAPLTDTRLERLVLSHAAFPVPLAAHGLPRSLRVLDISGCDVADVTPLVSCQSLETLNLNDNPSVTDISPLVGIRTLSTLKISSTSVKVIPVLPALEDIDFSNTRSVDSGNLGHCGMLKRIICSAADITDLRHLASCAQLKEIDCNDSDVEHLPPFHAALEFIACRASRVKDLPSCPSLRHIDCSLTDVFDLGPLAKSTSIEHLACFGCEDVTDLRPIGPSFAALRHLDCGCTGVRSLKALAGFAALEVLCCPGCAIISVAPLSRCKNLRVLDLTGCNGIYDIKDVMALPRLIRVDCSGTSISTYENTFRMGVTVSPYGYDDVSFV